MTYCQKGDSTRRLVTDEDVLKAIAEYPGSSYHELARRLGVCVTTIRRRMRILIAQNKVEVRKMVQGNSHGYLVYCDPMDAIADTAEEQTMLSVRAFFRNASPYARNTFAVLKRIECPATVQIIQHRGFYTLNVLCDGESRCRTLGFELCVDSVRKLHDGMPLQVMSLVKRDAPEGTIIWTKDMPIVMEVAA